MAWRIADEVVRGEIDCRTRGHITGRIWLSGRILPVELDLKGCPWRDLAGHTLTFINPTPNPPGTAPDLATEQHGAVGDFTASRKCRVPDIPIDQVGEYYARREKFPWHWANTVYLEWFSARNGRVVIESAEYAMDVSIDATWSMTEEEEREQLYANSVALQAFMERLVSAADDEDGDDSPGSDPLDEDKEN